MNLRKKLAAVAITAGIALTATTAFAYWTATGTGSGSASSDAGNHPVAVTQVGGVTGMYPGGAAQAVDFKINNPAPYKQRIASVSVSLGGTVWQTGCSTDDFEIVQPTAINQDLPSGDTTFSPSGASIAMKDRSTTNQDGCKGQALVVSFSAN